MAMSNGAWRVLALVLLTVAGTARADDIRPEAEARPMADERCIEQCDIQSDRCMQESAGDDARMQVCDDKYSECLQACQRAGAQ